MEIERKNGKILPSVNGINEKKKGSFHWKRNLSVKQGRFKVWCLEAFCRSERYTWKPALKVPMIEFVKADTMVQEEYLIEIEAHKITISALDERGVIWAFRSRAEVAHREKMLGRRRIPDKATVAYSSIVSVVFSVQMLLRRL